MNYKELKQQAIEASKPRYDEKSGGIFISALGIIIDLNSLSESSDWDEAMDMAKDAGKRLPTIDEMRYIYCYKDSINAIIEEYGGTPLSSMYWSSTKFTIDYAWYVYFMSGYTNYVSKHLNISVRAVEDV